MKDDANDKQRYLDPMIQKLADYYHADRIIAYDDKRRYEKVIKFEYPSHFKWSQFSVQVIDCDKFGMVGKDAKPRRHCHNPFVKIPKI